MLTNRLIPAKEIKLKFIGKRMPLPDNIQRKIDDYWGELIKSGKKYVRGEVFSLEKIGEKNEIIEAELSLSDYAHYLYSRNVGLPFEYACKNIHTSCLIETSDCFLIFGRMGEQTSRSGVVQCLGGGLEKNDIKGDVIDLQHNIKQELLEEVNLDSMDEKIISSLELKYLKFSSNINSAASIFLLKLKISMAEFKKRYENFEAKLADKKELPEFGEIVYLKKEKTAVEEFCCHEKALLDHYMEALIKEMVK